MFSAWEYPEAFAKDIQIFRPTSVRGNAFVRGLDRGVIG